MTLGEFLTLEGLTPLDFADKIGVHQEAVKLWVSGKRYPRRESMRKIIKATKGRVQPNDFMAVA